MVSDFGAQFGDLHLTGWVAAAPTGHDEAFLLLSTPDDAAAVTMPAVARTLGLPHRPGAADTAPADPVRVVLADGWVRLEPPGDVLERPVHGEWVQVARTRRQVVLVVGMVPLPSGMDPDEYTRRHGGACSLAVVPLAAV